jgi:flagellar hook-basal body complex protein FliE
MAIPAIKPIGASLPLGGTPQAPAPSTNGGGDSFGSALGAALEKLNAGQLQASQASQDLATGKATDITSVVSEVEKASLELQLATQVRNKVVDAYSELMRMQI